MNRLYTGKVTFELNGKTHEAAYDVKWELEDEPVNGSFEFGNEKENEDYLKRFASGELLNVFVRVTTHFMNLEASDSLGGCHIVAAKLEEEIKDIVRDYTLIDNATEELKGSLDRLSEVLK